jgi:hypothetical protein
VIAKLSGPVAGCSCAAGRRRAGRHALGPQRGGRAGLGGARGRGCQVHRAGRGSEGHAPSAWRRPPSPPLLEHMRPGKPGAPARDVPHLDHCLRAQALGVDSGEQAGWRVARAPWRVVAGRAAHATVGAARRRKGAAFCRYTVVQVQQPIRATRGGERGEGAVGRAARGGEAHRVAAHGARLLPDVVLVGLQPLVQQRDDAVDEALEGGLQGGKGFPGYCQRQA